MPALWSPKFSAMLSRMAPASAASSAADADHVMPAVIDAAGAVHALHACQCMLCRVKARCALMVSSILAPFQCMWNSMYLQGHQMDQSRMSAC